MREIFLCTQFPTVTLKTVGFSIHLLYLEARLLISSLLYLSDL